MWTYNYELYHHGVRRAQRKAARAERKAAKKAEKERENAEIQKHIRDRDILDYGKGGAKRIAKDVMKGKSHAKAELKEVGRRILTTTMIGAGTLAVKYFVLSGGAKTVRDKGKSAVNKFMDSRYNASILDATGKTIRRMNINFSEVKPSDNSLVPFRQ